MYEIVLSSDAAKSLARLQRSDRKLFRQIATGLDQLASEPYLGKALLSNLKGYYSYRVRDWRILYEIEKNVLRVLILKVEHRREVYK